MTSVLKEKLDFACRKAKDACLRIQAGLLVGLVLFIPSQTTAQDQVSARADLLDGLARAAKMTQGEGIVIAANSVDISNAVTSVVTEIHFEAEQFVEAGDLLYSLDNVEFALAVQAAEAEVLRATARLSLAQTALYRAQKLSEGGTLSDVALEEATAAKHIAEAALALAEVKLLTAQQNLSYTTILAPIDGIIGPSLVSVGAFVEAIEGTPMTRIVQLDPIFVAYNEPYGEQLELFGDELSVPVEELLDFLRIKVQITEDLEYPIYSKPSRMSGAVDPDTGTITLWSEFANPYHILRPGMRVKVFSEIEQPSR